MGKAVCYAAAHSEYRQPGRAIAPKFMAIDDEGRRGNWSPAFLSHHTVRRHKTVCRIIAVRQTKMRRPFRREDRGRFRCQFDFGAAKMTKILPPITYKTALNEIARHLDFSTLARMSRVPVIHPDARRTNQEVMSCEPVPRPLLLFIHGLIGRIVEDGIRRYEPV